MDEEVEQTATDMESSSVASSYASELSPYSNGQDSFSFADSHCDLISFLAVAQTLDVDIYPIVWQPALDDIGLGGTAEIRQALMNLQISFAFKCTKQSQLTWQEDVEMYRRLMSEVSVQAHPPIRDHPNVIMLEGVCWDLLPDGGIWPVLIFEKTKFGNLAQFLASDEGKAQSFEMRLSLSADIAFALGDVHLCGEFVFPASQTSQLNQKVLFMVTSSLKMSWSSCAMMDTMSQKWPILVIPCYGLAETRSSCPSPHHGPRPSITTEGSK